MSPRTPEPRRAGRPGRHPAARAATVAALLLALASGAVAGEQWGWLGVRIRDLSEQEMEEIAKKAGVSRAYVFRLEVGGSDPTVGVLQKLARALKVKLSELLGE